MSKTFLGEKLLIKVINDLADFLPYLVLVGGWVPYIYAKYIWKNVPNLAVTTADIDFGVANKEYAGKESVASYVRKLGYGEHHVSMDRMIPFVPVVKDAAGSLKAEVEFIVDPKISKNIRDRVIGREIKVNEIENFGSVDSKGPMLVEQENGPDAYIGDLRQDIFEKFNNLQRND